jgi:hypothetical protein
LAQVVPGLRQKFVMGQGASETSAGLTTLLLSRMTMDGTLTRGRPTGSWRSSQFTYALAEPLVDPPELEVAATLVLGEYLRAFGPASPEDCFWWTGWTKTQTRRAAEALGVVEVRLSSGEGWALPETLDLLVDLGVSGSDGPSVALLPSLDGSTMGWRDRDWYLADRAGPLFDARGNAGPTVWCDGEAIGGWGQREGGEVVNRLLVDRGREINELVEAEAARIGQWLDGVVVTPRYRSVLEKELAATRGR